MTKYYVSPTGSDAADGLSEATAWKSITFLNTKLAATIGKGDMVLLDRANGPLYGKLRPPAALSATTPGYLTFASYGPYGRSRRSEITSYKNLNIAGGWNNEGGGVWSILLTNAQYGISHDGYDGAQNGATNSGAGPGDIGFLKVDGTIFGKRVFTQGDLAAQWDFFCDTATDRLYVKSSANPTTLGASIQAATEGNVVGGGNALKLVGLKLTGSGGHGFGINANGKVRVYDCEFAELGGALLDSISSTTRYGNGFQAYIGCFDVLVERNEFRDIYDTATTMQGGNTGQPNQGGWNNVVIRHNLIYRCSQSFEVWSQGSSGTGFVDCAFEDNICLFGGYGWGALVRGNQNNRVHLLSYNMDLPSTGLAIRRNVFYDGFAAYRYSAAGVTPHWVASDNLIFQRAGSLLKYADAQTIEQAAAWVAAVSNDLDSKFYILPTSDPTDIGGALAQIAAESGAGMRRIEELVRAAMAARGEIEVVRASAESDIAALGGTNVQIFTASGTWNKPTGCVKVHAVVVGAGGGGGSGRRGAAASQRLGGPGGSGGGISRVELPASVLAASVAVTVGAAGAGGAAQTVDSTDGNTGVAGGASGLSSIVRAAGGGAGVGGTSAASASAGAGGAGSGGAGGQGGGVQVASAGQGFLGTTNVNGPGGGGGGGSITTGDVPGGGGGGAGATTSNFATASGGVVGGAAPAVGNAAPANSGVPGGGGGGGAASITGAAQAGAAGGIYGGGGGGGGASLNGNNSGAGAAGAAGIVLVIAS